MNLLILESRCVSSRARRVRRGRWRRGEDAQQGGLLVGPVHPGRVHHVRQLPRAEAGRLHLRVRAQERQELRALPPVRLQATVRLAGVAALAADRTVRARHARLASMDVTSFRL